MKWIFTTFRSIVGRIVWNWRRARTSSGANTCWKSMHFNHLLSNARPNSLSKCISTSSGAPTLIRESELSTEYLSDVDDKNLTEQRFLPGLPGELTKISSALVCFKICRILSCALDQFVPASVAYRLSMSDVKSISDELDQWLKCIPTYLRMKFLNDKPSTGVISDRSLLLV